MLLRRKLGLLENLPSLVPSWNKTSMQVPALLGQAVASSWLTMGMELWVIRENYDYVYFV